MCGINGIVDKNKKVNLNEIYKMNASINHRGPDDQGVISFNNACIGHVRLSIQDLGTVAPKFRFLNSAESGWVGSHGRLVNLSTQSSTCLGKWLRNPAEVAMRG